MDYTRRDFLKQITSATLGAAGLLSYSGNNPAKSNRNESNPYALIPDGGTLLFQGDSITDAGRDRDDREANAGLGHGYTFLAAAQLLDDHAAEDIQIYNRGVSGDKAFQLADRWEADCLKLRPDLLSILVGVNDFWHTLGDYDGTVEVYEEDFMALIERTKQQLPEVQLIIGEPFVVKEGSKVSAEEWFPAFNEYQAAAKRVARKFEAAFIPYQEIFDEAGKRATPTYWTGDGVHPTLAGSNLMAEAWLETAKRV
jgi:lysophospholipase L1-like esterase